jgi:hypothetical protein
MVRFRWVVNIDGNWSFEVVKRLRFEAALDGD